MAHLDVAVEALGLRLDAEDRGLSRGRPYRPRDEINDQNPVRPSPARCIPLKTLCNRREHAVKSAAAWIPPSAMA